MIGQAPRGGGMDAYSLAFAPIRAAQDVTMGSLQQLAALQDLRQKPMMAERQSQDNFLRSMGDLLPPEVLNYIIQQRLPEMATVPQGPAMPPGVSPEQLQMFQQMLQPQQ